MVFAIQALILQIGLVKVQKTLLIKGPLQRKGVVVVKYGIEWGQRVVIAQLALFFCQFEFGLLVQCAGHQPQIGRIKFNTGGF